MTYASFPSFTNKDSKTFFRGKQHLLSTIVFFIVYISQKLSVFIDIRVISIVLSWLISGLYHTFDSRLSWWGSKILEIVDYMVIGLNITSPYLQSKVVQNEVMGCMCLDLCFKLYEIKRNAELHHIVKQIPHFLEVCINFKELMKQKQTDFVFLLSRNIFQMVGVMFWYVSKKTNEWWSGHETSHLILCITDYILLFNILDK